MFTTLVFLKGQKLLIVQSQRAHIRTDSVDAVISIKNKKCTPQRNRIRRLILKYHIRLFHVFASTELENMKIRCAEYNYLYLNAIKHV